MTTTETTPAIAQADLFADLAQHLRDHSWLPTIKPSRTIGLQISGHDPVVDAAAVLLWAQTLTAPVVELGLHYQTTDRTSVEVTGFLASGRKVMVWDVEGGDLFRWVDTTQRRTRIELDQLAAYVAAGTVKPLTEGQPLVLAPAALLAAVDTITGGEA